MRRRLVVILLAGCAVLGGATVAPAAPLVAGAPAASLKTCGAGDTHGVINGAEKCLRAGEFCSHSADRQYRRYGYRCHKYDPRVQRYRLTRG